MTPVTLYVPPFVVFTQVSDQFQAFCQAKGYEVVSVDNDGKPWWRSLERAHQKGVEVILAADPAHLPRDYAPRVEIADLSLLYPGLPESRRRRNPGA